MQLPTRIMKSTMAAVLFACSLSVCSLAQAEPKPADVKAAIEQQDYAKAERLLLEVLASHPENAKAHHLYSEVLAKNGRYAEAKVQLAKAKELDPSLGFVSNKAALEAFEKKLNQAITAAPVKPISSPTAPIAPTNSPSAQQKNVQGQPMTTMQANQSMPTKSEQSKGWGFGFTLLMIVLGILAIYIVVKIVRGLFGGGQPNNAYQNYGSGGFGGAMPPQGGGSSGGGVASHLLAGAGGFAAGMLVDRMINGNDAHANDNHQANNQMNNQLNNDQGGYSNINNNQPDFSHDAVDYGSNLDSWSSGSSDSSSSSWDSGSSSSDDSSW